MKKSDDDNVDLSDEEAAVTYEPEIDAVLEEDTTSVPVPAPKSSDQVPIESAAAKRSRYALLGYQLNRAARESSVGGLERRADMRKGTIAAYERLAPRDAIDSMLASLMVAIHNQTMDCIAHSGIGFSSGQPIKLQYSIKGAKMLIELTDFYEGRRGGGRQNVTVNTVNVEQGGNAIVGNVSGRASSSSPDEDG